jgi:hypothetical protein
MFPTARIQPLQCLQPLVFDSVLHARCAKGIGVVADDQLLIGGQMHVKLDRIIAALPRQVEARQRVFRRIERFASMRDNRDGPF